MFPILQLPTLLILGVTLAPFSRTIALSYTCSKNSPENTSDGIVETPKRMPPPLKWSSPLSLNRIIYGNPRLYILSKRVDESFPAVPWKFTKIDENCDQRFLFLPVPIKELAFPMVEVLPNRKVCLNGRELPNNCMPNSPRPIPVWFRGQPGSLIVSSP